MKSNLDCIPCFQRQALKAMRMNKLSDKDSERILKLVMKKLINLDWSLTPPDLAREVYRIIKKETKIKDPYLDTKKESNDLALSMILKLRRLVDDSSDELKTALKLSVAGNIMDYGVFEKFDVEKTIEKVLKDDFAINDYELFKKKLANAKSLLFFADNAGEIVFDKVLLEAIMNYSKNDKLRITLVVKGGPIINDATIDDAKQIGMDMIPNIEFKTIDNGDSNSGPLRSSLEVFNWIKSHDLVISKGQGNYEGLSQYSNVFFLLIAKCNVISNDLGVKEGSMVLKYSGGLKK